LLSKEEWKKKVIEEMLKLKHAMELEHGENVGLNNYINTILDRVDSLKRQLETLENTDRDKTLELREKNETIQLLQQEVEGLTINNECLNGRLMRFEVFAFSMSVIQNENSEPAAECDGRRSADRRAAAECH
jgi:hypothetical protein